jgi:hypothetical protein
VTAPPRACAIAFKEWAGVCDALLQGRQSIIVRKGGISEEAGPGSFRPEHCEFWLYPTWSHQAEQALRTWEGKPSRPYAGGTVSIQALVQVELFAFLESEEMLDALDSFHVFTQETMRKRFHYRRRGLWVLCTRVWRREPEWSLPVTPEHAGCKTWVVLEEELSTEGVRPVLEEPRWSAERLRLQSALGGATWCALAAEDRHLHVC